MQTIRRRLIPLLALLTLALIPAQADAAKSSQASATQQASRAATAFDYSAQAKKLSQPRYETEKEVIQLPAYDGELLYIEVTKPKAAGHWPVILEAEPVPRHDRRPRGHAHPARARRTPTASRSG